MYQKPKLIYPLRRSTNTDQQRYNTNKMGSTESSNGNVVVEGDYTAPAVQVTFDGLLFDMDGTIIDSTAAVVKHWNA